MHSLNSVIDLTNLFYVEMSVATIIIIITVSVCKYVRIQVITNYKKQITQESYYKLYTCMYTVMCVTYSALVVSIQ